MANGEDLIPFGDYQRKFNMAVSYESRRPVLQVGLSRHFCGHDGTLQFADVGLDILEASPLVQYRFFEHDDIVGPEQIEGLNAIISMHERYPAETLRHADELLAILYFGVGYDHFDVGGCTDADLLLIIQKGSVDNSMAESIVAWMLRSAIVSKKRTDWREPALGRTPSISMESSSEIEHWV